MSAPLKIDELSQRIATDVAGAMAVGMGCIGDRLGLFKALSYHGPCTAAVLANHCGLNERYVLEWLKAVVAQDYVEYDQSKNSFFLTEAQKKIFAEEASPQFQAAYFQFAHDCLLALPEVVEQGFRRGLGVAPAFYGEMGTYDTIGRMHSNFFRLDLVDNILNPIPGLPALLSTNSKALDVGCGQGGASLALAKRYPITTCVGVDPHQPSIDRARAKAANEGLANAVFECAEMETFGEEQKGQFDFVLAFDCIHDMANPLAALKAIRISLKGPASLFVWSEPAGSVNPIENRNDKGRSRSGFSVLHCMTVSLSQGGAGLGTLLGVDMARDLAGQAGFGSFEVLASSTQSQYFFLLSL